MQLVHLVQPFNTAHSAHAAASRLVLLHARRRHSSAWHDGSAARVGDDQHIAYRESCPQEGRCAQQRL
jgi:hypothetical protein